MGRTLNERTRTFFTRLRIRTDTETAAGRIIVVSNWRVYIIINTRFVETADPFHRQSHKTAAYGTRAII